MWQVCSPFLITSTPSWLYVILGVQMIHFSHKAQTMSYKLGLSGVLFVLLCLPGAAGAGLGSLCFHAGEANGEDEDPRTVWLWVHPAAAKEALAEIREACVLEGAPWAGLVDVSLAYPLTHTYFRFPFIRSCTWKIKLSLFSPVAPVRNLRMFTVQPKSRTGHSLLFLLLGLCEMPALQLHLVTPVRFLMVKQCAVLASLEECSLEVPRFQRGVSISLHLESC